MQIGVQKVNGETTNTVTVSTDVIKEATKEIITKGTIKSGDLRITSL